MFDTEQLSSFQFSIQQMYRMDALFNEDVIVKSENVSGQIQDSLVNSE